MNKEQAIHQFWSSFGIPAYDENTVPQNVKMPYITYSVSTGSMDSLIILNASIWYGGTSWKAITEKKDEIAKKLGEHGYYKMKIGGGYVWFAMGDPFAQRMTDSDNTRRIYLNVQAEFLTAY